MKNDSIILSLQRTGLSKKKAIIYACLLDLGGAYPSRIAEYTKINRSTVYKILEDLSLDGLVTEFYKGKKMYYQIEKPNKLVGFTKDQIRKSENNYDRAVNLLPELEGIHSLIKNKTKIRFFEGKKGVEQIYDDHVNSDNPYTEMYGYSNTAKLTKFLSVTYLKSYIKKKVKLGIISKGIFPDTESDYNYNEKVYSGIPKKYLPIIKHIPSEMFPYDSEVTIYGNNRVSIVNFYEKDLAGIIIEDKVIYNMMKMIFELAWLGAKTFK